MTQPICGSCKLPITVCPDCGGKKCMDGCVDRMEDGCTCSAPQATSPSEKTE